MRQSSIVVKGVTCRVSKCGKYYFDEQDALRFVNFIEKMCVHVKGPLRGQPLILLPWLRDDVIMPVFGTKRIEDHFRRYTDMFVYIGRKNSKTLGMAALALALTAIDGEQGAEIYNIAATDQQARILFNMSAEMIELSKKLQKIFSPESDDVLPGSGIIKHRASGSFMRVLSGTSKAKTGGNPHALFVDEEHEFDDLEVVDNIATGMGIRNQPLTAKTTTAGNSINKPWYEDLLIARKIRDGIIDMPHYLPVIYEPDPDRWDDDSWRDPDVHKQANPGYGISVKPQYFERKIKEAEISEERKAKFIQFNCNRFAGAGLAAIKPERWSACLRDYGLEQLRGKRCFGGLDLADTRDLNAFVLEFPERHPEDDDVILYSVLSWFWAPEKAVENKKLKGYLYPQWVREGFLEQTPGDVTDLDFIRERIKEISGLFDVQEIGYDPYNARTITTKMQDKDRLVMTEVRPTYLTQSPAFKDIDILVGRQRLLHNGHPVMTFCVSNAVIKKDSKQNIMIDKVSEDNKIDGFAALLTAHSRAMVAPPPKRPKKLRIIE